MKSLFKNKFAFTLSEVMVVFSIIAIVVVATSKIITTQANYANKFLYYATFINLKQAVGNIMADGYTLTSGASVTKQLPPLWDQATPQTGAYYYGLCQRLTSIMNTEGTISCSSITSSNFSTATPDFITTNGSRFFSASSSATTITPYTIYVDINGTKGSAVITKDVMGFTIGLDGTVRPLASSLGAKNTDYLSASVRYKDTTNKKWVYLYRGVTYQQAVCESGDATSSTYTCDSYSEDATCTSNGACEVVINKPGF